MVNKVALTDEELALIQASLSIVISSYESYKERKVISIEDEMAVKKINRLWERLNVEYF